MSNNQNGDQNMGEKAATIITLIIVAFFVIVGYLSCNSDSGIDVVHDPNGFMGYSDSFWEWASKQ